MDIISQLFSHEDKEYKAFTYKLNPALNPDKIIGVRTPVLKQMAKEMYSTDDAEKFLKSLPHYYFEENQLHAFLIGRNKDYSKAIKEINAFLPFVDNWATCDQLKLSIKAMDWQDFYQRIEEWVKSDKTFTIRFGVEMLMNHYLDENFSSESMELAISPKNNDYYVKMMIAWYMATALFKQYNSAINVLINKRLERWTHNKSIQKACESYRITPEQKIYLKTLIIP